MDRDTGFTLIELIVAMALISVLLLLATPSLKVLIQNNSLTTDANSFVIALNYARSEAVKRKVNMTLCPSSNGTSCLTNKEWESGWLIYADVDDDGSLDTSGADPDVIVRIHGALSEGSTLRATLLSAFETDITYNSRGFAPAAGALILCDSRGLSLARAIEVNLGGRIQLTRNSESTLFDACDGTPH